MSPPTRKPATARNRTTSPSGRSRARSAPSRTRRGSRGALRGSTGVLVLGMHRSGTSVVARGLKALGVYLGDSLLGPAPENPKGHWEHTATFAINEQVMAAIERPWWCSRPIAPETWQSSDLDELKLRATSVLVDLFRGRRLWGFKDPRTIRLFPFWREVLGRLGCSLSIVLAIRPPASAIASLGARDGMAAADAENLWLAYMLPSLPAIAEHPVVVVDYDRLIRARLRELRRVANHLGVAIDPRDPEITRYTRSFVERDLRHHVHQVERASAGGDRPSRADQTYAALLNLTRSRGSWRRCLQLAHRYRSESADRSATER